MIKNSRFRIKRSEVSGPEALPELTRGLLGKNTLRWYIAQATEDELTIEATTFDGGLSRFGDSADRRFYPGRRAVLNIIPTGIGCSIGGYAGDAGPVTDLLASTADYLITNPNAVNASDFIALASGNIVYTEGSCIDLYCRGVVDLFIPYSNSLGVVIERTSDSQLDVVFNIMNAVRAVHGVPIVDYVITDQPIGGRCVENDSGAFVGTVDNPDVLFDACERLVKKGANAIAITSDIQDLPLDSYAKHFAGESPNPIGGVEAIISYLVTNRYRLPAAHAPLTNLRQLDLTDRVVDARGAAEISSESGFACILVGLKKAPQIRPDSGARIADVVNIHNLVAVVAPSGALGGIPAIYAQSYGIPVIAVRENETILDVTQARLQLKNVVTVQSYLEAAGALIGLMKGIDLESLTRPLKTIRYH